MKTRKRKSYTLTEEVKKRNLIESNQFAATVAVLLSLVWAVIITVQIWGYNTGVPITRFGVVSSLVLYLVAVVFASAFRFEKSWICGLLLASITYGAAVSYFTSSGIIFVFFILPAFISVRYCDVRLVQKAGGFAIAVFLITVALSFYLDGASEQIKALHMEQKAYWDYPVPMLLYQVLPDLVVLILVQVIGVSIARHNLKILVDEANTTSKYYVMAKEMSAAADIQNYVLPKDFEAVSNDQQKVFAKMKSAKAVAGDFYDCFTFHGKTFCLVADVSDKGLPSAMFMMSARNTIRCLLQTKMSLSEAMEEANKRLCENNMRNMFVTMFIIAFDNFTGDAMFVNAGHLPPILKKHNGQIVLLETEADPFLGVFEDVTYTPHTFRLEDGDTLFLYTDGVTDANNESGEMFGIDRVVECAKSAPSDPCELCECMDNALNVFVGETPQYDDITMMAFHWAQSYPRSWKCVLPATVDSVDIVVDKMNEMLEAVDCNENVRRQIDVAIDEVLSNIVNYAYEGCEGEKNMYISFAVNSKMMVFRTYDRGIPFNPLLQEDPDIMGEPKIGGLGIYLVEKIMSYVSYDYMDGMNVLTLKKDL